MIFIKSRQLSVETYVLLSFFIIFNVEKCVHNLCNITMEFIGKNHLLKLGNIVNIIYQNKKTLQKTYKLI